MCTIWLRALTTPIRTRTNQPKFTLNLDGAWFVMPGWTITTPKGSVTFTNKISYSGRPVPLSEAAPDRAWSLMYKSGLKEAAASVPGVAQSREWSTGCCALRASARWKEPAAVHAPSRT